MKMTASLEWCLLQWLGSSVVGRLARYKRGRQTPAQKASCNITLDNNLAFLETELRLKAGEIYSRQGDAADAMFVILDGHLQGRGEIGGETIIIDLEPGDVTGLLPFSRMKQFRVNGRAETDSLALRFPAALEA